MRTEAGFDFAEDEQFSNTEPEGVQRVSLSGAVVLPGFFCARIEMANRSGLLCDIFLDAAAHTKPGGYYIAIENFVDGQDNMNSMRRAVGLRRLPMGHWLTLRTGYRHRICADDRVG